MIGYDESEQLDVEPARYFVRVTKREKRACRRCSIVTAASGRYILDTLMTSGEDVTVAAYAAKDGSKHAWAGGLTRGRCSSVTSTGSLPSGAISAKRSTVRAWPR